jgi:hypothetical protein
VEEKLAPEIAQYIQARTYRDRGCLVMHWTEDCRYTLEDVAMRFGQSIVAVKVAKHRALKWFRRAFSGVAADDPKTAARKRGAEVWDEIEAEIVKKYK